MKLNKQRVAIAALASAFLLIGILFSCNKPDLFQEGDSPDGFYYYQNSMSQDENIQAMHLEIRKLSTLLANRAKDVRLSRKGQLTIDKFKKKPSAFKEAIKSLKSEKEYDAFFEKSGIPLNLESAEIQSSNTRRLTALTQFAKNNPAFGKLEKQQQMDLFLHAFKKIELQNKSLFRPTQEQTVDQCNNSYESTANSAYAYYLVAIIAVDAAFLACEIFTATIGSPICLAELVIGNAAAAAVYNLALADAQTQLDRCLAAIH